MNYLHMNKPSDLRAAVKEIKDILVAWIVPPTGLVADRLSPLAARAFREGGSLRGAMTILRRAAKAAQKKEKAG